MIAMAGDEILMGVSTHSRPKAAGCLLPTPSTTAKFQHTAARRRLAMIIKKVKNLMLFQHTAARRRLAA